MGNKPRVLTAKSSTPPVLGNQRPESAVILYVMKTFSADNTIKIGIGKTPEHVRNRQKSHEAWGPTKINEMEILALLWADTSDESYIKDHWKRYALKNGDAKRFTHHRIGNTEWFPVNEEIGRWVVWLTQQPYVTKDLDQIEKMSYITDSSKWLPPLKNPLVYNGGFEFTRINSKGGIQLETDVLTEGDYYSHPFFTRKFAMVTSIGRIVLDPASCRLANNHPDSGVHAERFYGALQDGLSIRWDAETVWLNPPFGRWELWAAKAINEFQSGRVKEMGVLLTANSSTNKNVAKLLKLADCVVIPSKRYNFWGSKASSPPDGHLMLYFGPNVRRCIDVFEDRGTVKINAKFYRG